jgi:glycogen operon protein
MNACRPWQSVNYITSHDGFTLYDLVSYNQKRNWANGHNNTDGAHEFSGNCGWEGDDGVEPEVVQRRKQEVKNFCCLLLLSAGTPMFRMGDEFLQTQGGNNNPYNQDNATTWLDWQRLDEHREIFRFFQRMIAFRKSHPSLGRQHFWSADISWYGEELAVDMSYEARTLAYCLHGSSAADRDMYVMINASPRDPRFGIHEGAAGQWKRSIDTSLASPNDITDPGQEPIVQSTFYHVQPHSVVVLLR